ncbi:N-acyl-aromatic-L-amino acid amidohydrolase (carboxylate-forming) B-like isoform X1 [Gadus macrocephalus]|uniref:N-acyl-aromatic-L-amino acid amidohydrolase (carboxylate-forming) B-like isoform X1 n=2 Tax=Gadus macrocephalus TaxID=80720 RepID=UPI0028CB211F|nr:N-acyl-aromatic-L-amino acid amidohydrolase (carboxylate-forming) B-like isoform X1 [Gadus macrocephalus]
MRSLRPTMERERVYLPALSRVAVCGGTHGNELSGVHVVRERLKEKQQRVDDDEEEDEDVVSVSNILTNPRAVQQCRRYTETDLNRCFTRATLSSAVSDRTPYEIARSQELNVLLGPKGSPQAVDLVCDLHNTTANMGVCVIAYSDTDWICLHIFKYLQHHMSDVPVRYIHFDLPCREAYSLDSLGKHGFALEIGPQPHGVVRSNVYTYMKTGVELMLDWVRLFNSGTVFAGGLVEVYTMVSAIDYPRERHTHNVMAAIHPELQDQDFRLLRPNDPLFETFSGATLRYQGPEPLYAFFINECAYYEKGIALSLARRRSVEVPPVQMKSGLEHPGDPGTSEEEEEED